MAEDFKGLVAIPSINGKTVDGEWVTHRLPLRPSDLEGYELFVWANLKTIW